MDEPTLAYWFSEDMVSSFFLFRLPDEWSALFALEKQAPGHTVDSDQPFEYVGLTILP